MLILLLLHRLRREKDPSEKRLGHIPASDGSPRHCSLINTTGNGCFHYLRQHDETMSKCQNQQHKYPFGASQMILFYVSFKLITCCTEKKILISCLKGIVHSEKYILSLITLMSFQILMDEPK